jgi:drug/metabolite transporter (DMT)-like permease
MNVASSHLRTKTRLLTVIVVTSNVLGNFCLSLGLKRAAISLAFFPLGYIEALFHPWVAVGVTLLILWLLSRMALLSWADLSYVLPVTAVGYLFTAIIGKFFLFEQVSWQRWAGTFLIMAGVGMVSSTPLRTTYHHTTEARPK